MCRFGFDFYMFCLKLFSQLKELIIHLINLSFPSFKFKFILI